MSIGEWCCEHNARRHSAKESCSSSPAGLGIHLFPEGSSGFPLQEFLQDLRAQCLGESSAAPETPRPFFLNFLIIDPSLENIDKFGVLLFQLLTKISLRSTVSLLYHLSCSVVAIIPILHPYFSIANFADRSRTENAVTNLTLSG